MQPIQIVRKIPFKMYPQDKASTYSMDTGNPLLKFQFGVSSNKGISSSSLRICGKMRIYKKSGDNNQLPANVFDIEGVQDVAKDNEFVAYVNDRIGVNSAIQSLHVTNLAGQVYEQIDNYHRNQASIIGATRSYKGLCSFANMLTSGCANNDVMARECSSEIEFALPVNAGYVQSNPILPLDKGQQFSFDLANARMVLFGANASNFVFSFRDVFLMGDYFETAKPLKGYDMDYTSKIQHARVITSGNDYQNVDFHKDQVQSVFHNFAPSDWRENYNYNAFSTCPLLEGDASTLKFKVARIKQYNINRGAVRYPNQYIVDCSINNREGSFNFQPVRSRLYLDSIFPYVDNKECLICAESEGLYQMIEPRDWSKTHRM